MIVGRRRQGVWDGHALTAIFKMPTRTYIAHGTLRNTLWQPGWQGSLEENGYMYMYG